MKPRTIGIAALAFAAATPAAMAQESSAPAAEPPPAAAAPAPMEGAAPATAAAAAPGVFGAPGQIAVSVDLPFTNEAPQLAIYHQSVSMGGPSSTTINIQPSLDYFVMPNLSVGGELGIFHGDGSGLGISGGSGGSVTATAETVEARVGYNIPLLDSISLWPRLGIGYIHVSASANGVDNTGYAIPLVVSVPLLWHAGSHFFLGAGPSFTTELAFKIQSMDQPKTTDYGLTAVVGGHFGGP